MPNKFREGLLLKLPMKIICNITPDGAPNVAEMKTGFVGAFNELYPEYVVFINCIIHKDFYNLPTSWLQQKTAQARPRYNHLG